MLFTIPGHTMMTTIFSSHLSTLSIVCWFGYYYYYYYYSFCSSFCSSFVFDFDFYTFYESDDAIVVIMMIYFLSSGFLAGSSPALPVNALDRCRCDFPTRFTWVSLHYSSSFSLCFSFAIIIIILLLQNIAYSCWLNTNNDNFDLGLFLHGRSSERLLISNISINYPLNLKKKTC